MGKELGEVFCKVCGKSSNDDNGNFHKKAELCNKHWIQIKRYGKPTGNERLGMGKLKKCCDVCNDTESSKYYTWYKDGELKGKELCNKHYSQMLKHNRLLDAIPSDHKERHLWTVEEESLLEDLYKEYKSIEEISKIINRSPDAISTKASELKLGNKYMRTNNPKFKAQYQSYDWCYERYIVKGMTHQEMAEEAGCKTRTIQKWCSEVHGLNYLTFKKNKQLNSMQYQVILFGTLGDGHIDRRIDQPMYIESHCESEKEYMYWKYEILKDLCHKEPVYYKESYNSFGSDKEYLCQPYYRINTRIINELVEIRDMPRLNKIKMLNEFGFSLHTLDDGYRGDQWQVCLAEWSKEEIETYIDICKKRFGLECYQMTDKRYISFSAVSSKKIDEIILKNIPNNLDIIRKKILNNKKIKNLKHYRYILVNGKKIGLASFCKIKHIDYDHCKNMFDTLEVEYIEEDKFMKLVI